MKTRKVPMRMCVGCREMKPKKELLRVVKSAEGDISFDKTGKQSGRGAYICASEACLQKAVKARMLERALDKKIDEALYDQLARELLRREL